MCARMKIYCLIKRATDTRSPGFNSQFVPLRRGGSANYDYTVGRAERRDARARDTEEERYLGNPFAAATAAAAVVAGGKKGEEYIRS